MMDKEELWKCEYLQRSFTYLTDENLDWLVQHCEKTIRYTTGNTRKEHLMVLELIEQHKQYLSLRADYLRRMKALNEVLRKQGYISKDKIKEKLEQNKAKTDCTYCNNTCDSYAVCMFCKELLEEK